jgi:Mn-dependent DtxR family transcriptional regulator
MNHRVEPGHAPSLPRFTQKQGQYLAFIQALLVPAEADLRRYFRVSPPSVHQMVITLERAGLIRRQCLTAATPH